MNQSNDLAHQKTMSGKDTGISESDNARLIRAIEAALRVSQHKDFQAWICGEFHALLPYESLVCLEIDGRDRLLLVECLQHSLIDARRIAALHHAVQGLARRLLRASLGRLPTTRLLEAGEIQAALAGEAGDEGIDLYLAKNALVHHIRFLSGDHYFLVLFNLPPPLLSRCTHLFKLLSAHVKMALSCLVACDGRKTQAPLTRRELEILREMKAGKSNREISAALGISPITLKNHVSKLYRKLDVQNRADAVSSGLHQAGRRSPADPIEPAS